VRRILRFSYRASRAAAQTALLPLNQVRRRRFDLCCCGLSKTGTHSIAGLFEGYRSAHHPDGRVRLRLASAYLRGEVDDVEAERILRRRDRLLRLEVESSSLAGSLIRPLFAACPDKRFVLTIRDVYSWCDSWLDHDVNQPPVPSTPWTVYNDLRLRRSETEPTPFDRPLVDRGLLPLECYFGLWTRHNAGVLETVSPERLLVVETGRILESVPEIAAWAGIQAGTLRTDRGWLYSTTEKHHLLSTLDPAYVRDTADRICGPLMMRFFPDATWSPFGQDTDLSRPLPGSFPS
jgi:hypothetical protein